MRSLIAVTVLALATIGCGAESALPTLPDPVPSPTPQTIVRLNVTARDATSGARLDAFRRDEIVLFEAGAVCALVNAPCPRPEWVEWRLSGAFCEMLGDRHAASVGAICSTTGLVRVEVQMPASGFQPQASGDASFRVLP